MSRRSAEPGESALPHGSTRSGDCEASGIEIDDLLAPDNVAGTLVVPIASWKSKSDPVLMTASGGKAVLC